MYSVRYYADDTKKCVMTTVVYADSEREARERFKSTHPKAVIISLVAK